MVGRASPNGGLSHRALFRLRVCLYLLFCGGGSADGQFGWTTANAGGLKLSCSVDAPEDQLRGFNRRSPAAPRDALRRLGLTQGRSTPMVPCWAITPDLRGKSQRWLASRRDD